MDSDYFHTLSDGRAGFPALMDAVEAHLARAGAPDTATAAVMVAMDEVVTNILNYGGADGSSPQVEVDVRVADGRIEVRIADDGAAFNPIEVAAPDTDLAIEDRAIGGLGIHLVKRLMDSVAYDRSEARNHLRFSKVFGPAPAS